MSMHDDIKEVFLSEAQIEARVKELAAQLCTDYEGRNPLLICVLKGASVFMTDLMKQMDIPLEIDFMAVSSYGAGMKSSGVVKIIKDLDTNISGRDMVIVEDILDSGLTLDYLVRQFEERAPRSITVCTLLQKEKNTPEEQRHDFNIGYVGFRIRDEFVVGYGLDFGEKYRNLPYIGVLKEEVYM